jgi:predicted nucleotide-binding protein
MFSILVSHQVEDKPPSAIEFDRDRFLEYTSDAVSEKLRVLSIEAIDWIKSWPCIVMQEGRGAEVAHVAKIQDLQAAPRIIRLKLRPISGAKTLVNDALWKIRTELDISQFEFNRNHWAFKDRDLFAILAADGYRYKKVDVGNFEGKQISAPTRRELLSARDAIANWDHTQLDDFVLEIGVEKLKASRTVGSRRDRANAIIEFALANPTATTAENSMLATFIVRAAEMRPDEEQQYFNAPPSRSSKPPDPLLENSQRPTDGRMPNRVFVVHGQNDAARTAVVKLLTSVGLEPVVLHEQPNMGRHLLTKFIDEAELVTFAIVLMTDDDVGGLKNRTLSPRARQNVILELGYFLSHLGQQKVCALATPGLETPSDFDGIVYIRMDIEGKWMRDLMRELKAAKMPLIE